MKANEGGAHAPLITTQRDAMNEEMETRGSPLRDDDKGVVVSPKDSKFLESIGEKVTKCGDGKNRTSRDK